MLISERIGHRRDSARERMLCRELRCLPEVIAFEEIREFLLHDKSLPSYQRSKLGLILANRVLRRRRLFYHLLDLSLQLADASTVLFWINAAVTRVGLRRLVNWMRTNADNQTVTWYIYWLDLRFSDEVRRMRLQGALTELNERTKHDK